jgi:ELWxxDGT repeat protein
MKKSLLLILCLFVIQPVISQELITNFSYKDGDRSSSPTDIVEFNNQIFFTATTSSFSREIWFSNGDLNNASLLKDINPGVNSGASLYFKDASVVLNDKLYFMGYDGSSSGEIWCTDGTTEGTVKVTDFLNKYIKKLTLVGDKIYFLVKEDDMLQVWVSDGTKAGTKLVKGEIPVWNTISFQGNSNDTFIFTFQAYGENDSEVWRSDGTLNGTFRIIDNIDGNGAGEGGSAALTQYIEYDDALYFISREYLYKTDGTLENTQIVTSFHNANSRLINYADVVEVNGKLYFSFYEMDYNRLFIWETDGTEVGSSKIYDVTGDRFYMTSNLERNGNNLVFCGKNASGGTSPVQLNLTDHSITFLDELEADMEAPSFFRPTSDACKMTAVSDNKYFISSPSENHKWKAWIADLNESTNTNILGLNDVQDVSLWGDLFYFSKETDLNGKELWRSDGTEENTVLCDNINDTKYGLLNVVLETLDSKLIFLGSDGIVGEEFWAYENGSVNLIKDILPGVGGGYLDNMTKCNNSLYFVGNDGESGWELWKSDGTEVGTKLISDILEGSESSYPSLFTAHKNDLFFTVSRDGHNHLCKTDGITVDFIKDMGVNSYDVPVRINNMISSENELYFVAYGNGEDLWKTDGTEGGTFKIKDLRVCNRLAVVDNKVFFTALDEIDDELEIWTSDGSEGGTYLVKDIGMGYSSEPRDLYAFNGALFFTAQTNENGREVWHSDGTPSGTSQLLDINPGSKSSINYAYFCEAGSHLYFRADNGTNGFELWQTDGSESETKLLKDINPGLGNSNPSYLVAIRDLIYFNAYDPETGVELWKCDGSENGVEMVADIMPGSESSNPRNMIGLADDVFFVGETTDKGRQVWQVGYNELICKPKLAPIADVADLPNITGECSVDIDTEPTATDDCGNTITGTTTDPLVYTEQGTYTLTWTFEDSEGHILTQQQTVIIDDVTNPVISLKEAVDNKSIDLEIDQTQYKVVGDEFDPLETTDNCDVASVVNDFNNTSTLEGALLPIGKTTITWTVMDIAENIETVSFDIIVNMTVIPIADVTNLPDLIGECSVEIDNAPTATDSWGNTITGTSTDRLTYEEQGNFTIIWTYEDHNGNASTQEQTVIVDDVTNPVISLKEAVDNKSIELQNDQSQYTVVGDEFDPLETTDNCDVASVVNDFNSTSTLEGALLPSGRTTITWTVTDIAENIETVSFDIIVNMTVGIEDVENYEISLYPNPTTNYVNLRLDNIENSSYSYQLYSIAGELIESKTIDENVTSIPMSHLVSSVYFIRLMENQKEVKTFKVIKN